MSGLLPLLAGLARVHVVCRIPRVEPAALEWAQTRGLTIEALGEPEPTRAARARDRLAALATRCNLRRDPALNENLGRVLRRFQPELLWLETPYLLRNALDCRGGLPVVVDYWGTSEGARRIFAQSRGPARLLHGLRWRLARNGETRYAPRVATIVCVSERDADYFRRIAPRVRVRVVPNVLDPLSRETLVRRSNTPPARMIFTGDFSYEPNCDAAVFFATEILPRIRQRVPEAHVVFAGRSPSDEVRHLSSLGGVRVTGEVAQLGDEIARSDLYVLPMRLGSGIRSKLYEVFPLAIPVVTTSIGAEGLVLRSGRNCLVADTPAGFAEACVQLLRSEEMRRRLGRALREDAVAAYAPASIQAALRRILEEVLESRQPVPRPRGLAGPSRRGLKECGA